MPASPLQTVKDSLQRLYLEDNRPWMVAFSGGKDSTMVERRKALREASNSVLFRTALPASIHIATRGDGCPHSVHNMKRTLEILNELERVGVMSRYAIGGAMGATFYVEPLLTFDLDVFVLLPQTAGGLLTLTPLYEALRARGYTEEGECVNIEGVPVQFLPAYNALLEEALREARQVDYEGTQTRVLRAEHLVAICLQTGRDKDRERVRILREQAELDSTCLSAVLQRHYLEAKWKQWTT